MSLLIKGMKMPEGCGNCPLVEGHVIMGDLVLICKINGNEYSKLHGVCPLTPIPNHGDLISREDLRDAIERTDWYHQTKSKEMVYGANSAEHQAWYKAQDIYAAVDNALTIIPADKEIK